MKKAKVIYKKKRNGQNIAQLRAGERGTGRIIAEFSYWPNHGSSYDTLYKWLIAAAKREGFDIVRDD